MKRTLPLFVLVSFLAGAQQSRGQDNKELAKLQGSWAVESILYDGKEFDKLKLRFVFKGNAGTVEGNDSIKKEYAKLLFKLDSTTKPPLMDVKVADGVQKDTTFEGIYEFKDGQLKMCLKIIGNDRPSEFAAPQGSNCALMVLKKEP